MGCGVAITSEHYLYITTREVAEDGRPFPPVSLPLHVLIESHARPTPLRPTGEQIRLIGIEHTAGVCPDRETVGPDILRDGLPMQPDLLGNRLERPPLARQMADLLVAQAPLALAWGLPCRGQRAWGSCTRRRKASRLAMRGLVSTGEGEDRGRHVECL